MKTQKLFMFFSSMLFLALLVSFVSAYNVNYPVYSATIEDNLSLTKTVTPVNDLSVIGYRCLDASCSSIDSANPVPGLSVHVTNNILPVVFPSTYYANGYVLYFYKDGYVGWAQYDNAWGSGTSTGVNIYLSKKRNAGAAIFNFLVDTNYGLTSATVDSAIKTTQFATIPLLEKIATTVNFKVNNTQTGQVFNLQSQNFLINYTLNQNVNFSYNFSQLPVGNYTITISTDVSSEAKIINPIANSQSRQILIFSSSNNTNQTNSTLPVINIISPVNGASYTNASILLNATSNQLVNWNYTLNGNFTNLGTSFNISLPLNVTNLINGTNVLVIFAGNVNGTVNQTIVFNYNSTIVPVIPLATISILSPDKYSYNVTAVLVNLSSSNAQAVWFNWNGTNQSYTAPVLINFLTNGTHTIFAYANNTQGNISMANFTFNINTSLTDTTPVVITNITTNPGMPFVNNGSSQIINVSFNSSRYPINLTFNLYNITSLVNTAGPFVLINSSSLPVSYIIPANLADGLYFLNMTVRDSLGNSATYVVGNFTVNKTVINNNPPHNNPGNDEVQVIGDNLPIFLNESTVLNSGNYTINLTPNVKSKVVDYRLFLYWLIVLILVLLILIILAYILKFIK